MIEMYIQPKIHLRNGEFSRVQGDGYAGFFRGHFYFQGNLTTSANFADTFELKDLSTTVIESWNGEFSCILTDNDGNTSLISDKKRTIPLFYRRNEDSSWTIQDYNADYQYPTIEKDALNDFLMTGFVSGHKTLHPDWFQTEACTIVELSAEQNVISYFSLQTEEKEQDFNELVSELKSIFHQIFDDLKERIGDKQIIIPLSGGYDSRIIALMLKERNLTDQILAFTYGRPNNLESSVSKQIADRLGLQWRYYAYDKAMWEEVYASDEWKRYVDYTFNGASVPHLQDFPSVKRLMEDTELSGAVFMPGHSLDYLAGGHLPYEAVYTNELSQDQIVGFIQDKHFKLWQTPNSLNEDMPAISSRIKETFDNKPFFSNELGCNIVDDWNMKERQSKFIINSVRVYEFYGQQWTLPLWDDRLIWFFKKVPVKWKYKKYLYDVTLHEMFPEYFEMPQPNEERVSPKNKYGVLYPALKKVYRTQKLWKQYYNEPMEWFGIYPSYYKYLSNLTFKKEGIRFSNPYNINSFIVKDTLDSLGGNSK
ncbi:hypothetical protein [Paenisporosarcina sp. NPDC076898]|uniref:hypothetical protein n=1 Tax=unclassified Paenisporosarcina TaxID=2642018 RepID=UPI003CFC7D29